MTSRDAAYLNHILESIAYIGDFSRTITSASDLRDHPLERAGIERMLTIIGEAAKNISPELRERYPKVPWKEVAGMRDKIMHHYFGVDYEAVYETIKHDIPELKQVVTIIMDDSKHAGISGTDTPKKNTEED